MSSDALVECAEREVAVGDEWAHAQFGGKGKRLAVVAFGLLDVGQAGGDLAQEAQRPSLVAAFLVVTGAPQSTVGGLACVICAPGPQIPLGEINEPGHRSTPFHGALQ